HGGAPQINRALERMGSKSGFRGGPRVTAAEAMDAAEMGLAGGANAASVGPISSQGGRAAGLSGRDASFTAPRRMRAVAGRDGDGNPVEVDLGRVGEIEHIEPRLVADLCASGVVPVIAPIGVDVDGNPLNVNADTAAGEIAAALQ